MNALMPIRRALRSLLPPVPLRPRSCVLHHLGFDAGQLDAMLQPLADAGEALGVELRLDAAQGDVVVVEQRFAGRASPQMLQAFLDDRPLLMLDAGLSGTAMRQHLQRQLRPLLELGSATPAAAGEEAWAGSTLPPASGYDSAFDTRQDSAKLVEAELDPDRAELLNRLRRGLVDPTQPPLAAGFGTGAAVLLDFAAGQAWLDEPAEQKVRLQREVPYLSAGVEPGPKARSRELDLVAWDIALAAGGFRLLHSPVNWWHTPLIARPGLNVARYTLQPQHLELARCLAVAPISPADLRRRCRVGLTQLRGFLQACLFLGLVYWVPGSRR